LSFGVQRQVQELASSSDSDTACPAHVPASGTPSTAGQPGAVPAVTASTIQVPSSCGEGAVQGPSQALLPGTYPVPRQDVAAHALSCAGGGLDAASHGPASPSAVPVSSGAPTVLCPAHDDDLHSTPAASTAPTDNVLPPPRRQLPAPTTEVLPHRTRLQGGIRQLKKFTDMTVRYGHLAVSCEPFNLEEALSTPHCKAANIMHFLETVFGTLFLLNIINCKRVYKIKQKADGSIDRYKNHLIVKGFKQHLDIDYNDTFSC
jgi:hypothetical protein